MWEAVIVLVVLMAMVAMVAACAAVAMMLVRRAAEVSTRHRVGAPVHWIATPSRPAMLHRRLRNAVAILRRGVPAPRAGRDGTPLQDLADEVEALAASLDRELLDTARLPFAARQAALARAATGVARVEDLAARIAAVAADGDPSRLVGGQWDQRAAEVEARLGVLRQAQAEVDELERRLGLG